MSVDKLKICHLRFCLAWIVCLLATLPAGAAVPLKDYVSRLGEAEEVVDEFTEGEHSAYEVLDAMAKVRQLVPEREDVESESGVVRVDNSWLHQAIDDVVKNAFGDVEQRRSLLIEIADRLFILHERINAAPSQQALKADEQRARLDRILAGAEYRPDEQKESSLRQLARRIWSAMIRFLSRFESSPRQQPAGAGKGITSGFRILLLLAVLTALLYGMFQLLKRLKLRRKSEQEKEVREVLGEEIAEGVTAADLFGKATQLARQGDYRRAIRRAYIALLFELEQAGKLRLHRSKTNRDYLDSLRSEREIFPAFSTMTGTFENVWYGQTRATEDEYNRFISRYHETIKLG
jgi:hypothetical protein